MELKLVNGKYCADGANGLASVSGKEELAQRIAMKLTARRGAFPLMPDFGSRLYLLGRTKKTEREIAARQYIAEALNGENIVLSNLNMEYEGDKIRMDITFEDGGDRLQIDVTV